MQLKHFSNSNFNWKIWL